MFSYIGDDDEYRAGGHSFYTVETHIAYLREAAGACSRCESPHASSASIASGCTSTTRCSTTTDDKLLATTEQMLVHVDMNAGRSVAILPDVRAALDAICSRPFHPCAGQIAPATSHYRHPGNGRSNRSSTLDFALSDEHQMIVDTVRSFTERELFPHEEQVEKLGEVPPELVRQIKQRSIDAGLYAANMPAELGGGGLDTLRRHAGRPRVRRGLVRAALHRRPAEQHPASMHR